MVYIYACNVTVGGLCFCRHFTAIRGHHLPLVVYFMYFFHDVLQWNIWQRCILRNVRPLRWRNSTSFGQPSMYACLNRKPLQMVLLLSNRRNLTLRPILCFLLHGCNDALYYWGWDWIFVCMLKWPWIWIINIRYPFCNRSQRRRGYTIPRSPSYKHAAIQTHILNTWPLFLATFVVQLQHSVPGHFNQRW